MPCSEYTQYNRFTKDGLTNLISNLVDSNPVLKKEDKVKLEEIRKRLDKESLGKLSGEVCSILETAEEKNKTSFSRTQKSLFAGATVAATTAALVAAYKRWNQKKENLETAKLSGDEGAVKKAAEQVVLAEEKVALAEEKVALSEAQTTPIDERPVQKTKRRLLDEIRKFSLFRLKPTSKKQGGKRNRKISKKRRGTKSRK